MLYMGADGATADSIEKVLEYDQALNKMDTATFVQLMMEQGEEDESIEVANTFLVDSTFKISTFYQKMMKTYFHSSIESLSHKTTDEKLIKLINKWASSSTHGRILEVLTEADLVCAETGQKKKLILVDVIYFKGRWAYQFDKKLTKPGIFWIGKNESVTVDMMEITVSKALSV